MNTDILSDNMLKKIIILFCFLWLCTVIIWYIQNNGLPLGFDHGIYAHLTHAIEKSGDIYTIPDYLRYQYEPFSGTFFYALTRFTGNEILYSWGYLLTYLLTGFSLFLLGKNKKKYTLGSLLGIILFLFSTHQYFNLFWSFGKQMFATFFLILFLRYQKKAPIALILLTACISLHRLTGFIAILYIFSSFIAYFFEKKKSYNYWIFLGVVLGIVSYILHGALLFQIMPLLHSNIDNYIMLSGNYGTGFSKLNFLFFITPSLLILFLMCVNYSRENKNIKRLLKKPLIITFLLLSSMVFLRSIGHSRMQTFIDLFLIIMITKVFFQYIGTKWIFALMIIQVFLWSHFAYTWHEPYISPSENNRIKNIVHSIPNNVKIVTLSPAYNAYLSKYTDKEIYAPGYGISQKIWRESSKKMRYDKSILCEKLGILSGNIFVYVGEKEEYTSTQNNPCLQVIKKWPSESYLYAYIRYK